MDIDELNALAAAEVGALVRSCADIPRWVDAVVAGRPYDGTDALLARADELAADWSPAEVEQALADHPRIGDRPAGAGMSAALSTTEQSGVRLGDAGVQDRLAAGNRAYEERFGRIFLVRAAGRGAEEILAQLEARLQNDAATELQVTAGQLREIAALRLAGLVS
jgi:2-oxo-4-hydroxy-4-carboxy-5-ureidoimidazoline decarboxylase